MTALAPDRSQGARLQLLGAFACTVGDQAVNLGSMPSALLAHLALTGRAMARRTLEQSLWPGLEEPAAAKRMRQVLWRIRCAADGQLLTATDTRISLDSSVAVDWEHAEADALRIATADAEMDESLIDRATWSSFTEPLLPDHDCPSVRARRLRWNHLRLSALRRLAENALASRETLLAVEFAAAAINIDELSEWPYQIIACAHIARRDVGLAARVLSEYSDLLRKRLNLSPSSTLRAQLQSLATSGAVTIGSSLVTQVARS